MPPIRGGINRVIKQARTVSGRGVEVVGKQLAGVKQGIANYGANVAKTRQISNANRQKEQARRLAAQRKRQQARDQQQFELEQKRLEIKQQRQNQLAEARNQREQNRFAIKRQQLANKRAEVQTRIKTSARRLTNPRLSSTNGAPVNPAAIGGDGAPRAGVLSRIANNPWVITAAATVGGIGAWAAYDNYMVRNDVPGVLDETTDDYRRTVLEALETLLKGGTPDPYQYEDGDYDWGGYDPWTGTLPFGDTGYTLGVPNVDTGIGWVDDTLANGGGLIYDDTGYPVAVMDAEGNMTGLYPDEAEKIHQMTSINLWMWGGLAALLGVTGYFVYKNRKEIKTGVTKSVTKRKVLV